MQEIKKNESDKMRKNRKRNQEDPYRNKRRIRIDHIIVWLSAIALTAAAIWLLLEMLPKDDIDVDALLKETVSLEIETETEKAEPEYVNPVPRPDIDVQHLTVNEFSRPGEKTDAINYIVIHYLGNPKTTAQQNHDYFESLKDLQDVSMSANFIVGIDGEIIECVPPGEIAYASNSMNHESISIENCHLDDTGRFTEDTYESCVKLAAYLAAEYQIDRDHIIRHYDVTGKACPLFYVEHEDKWEEMKDDIMNYIEECRQAAEQ